MKPKINIFGSCCTRELINYQNKYEVGCYVMQQSIFTMFSKPLNISYEDAKGREDSNFKKRMIYYEFNKLGLTKVLEAPSEFLIIDFADCRYDIYEFDNPKGVKIIYTHESRATFDNIKDINQFKNIEKHYCNVEASFTAEMITNILTEFCNRILQVYDMKQIILNRIQMNDTYYENNEEKKIRKYHIQLTVSNCKCIGKTIFSDVLLQVSL